MGPRTRIATSLLVVITSKYPEEVPFLMEARDTHLVQHITAEM